MSAYAQALRQAITPGCTVIDIGAGPGMFALLACRYGAGNVIAIEPDPSIILLKKFAQDNGFADRIEPFQGVSSDYHPLDKADVIISDLRGGLPYFEGHIGTIVDARERLLAPGGRLIPQRDTIHIAAVESASTYVELAEPWSRNDYGLDLSAGRRFTINSQRRSDFKPEQLLGPAQMLATIDYHTVVDPNLRASASLEINRGGVLHGLLSWFDTQLAPGVEYSNAPGKAPLIYSQTFFPLDQPLSVQPGDRLEVEIMANLVGGSYVWSWNSRHLRAGTQTAPAVRQSTFLSNIMDSKKLAIRSDHFVPPRPEAIDIDALCLSLINGEHDLKTIAERVEQQFPHAFAGSSGALDHVTKVASRYGART